MNKKLGTTNNKFGDSDIPPYTDAQAQLENRELRAEVARAKRLLKEATAQLVELKAQRTGRVSREMLLRRVLGGVEWGVYVRTDYLSDNGKVWGGDRGIETCPRCGHPRPDHSGHCELDAALRTPSPLADAAGALIEAAMKVRELGESWPYGVQGAMIDEVVTARTEFRRAADAYREALRDSTPLGDGRADGGAG
jgi:hypothetical protein